MDASVGTGLAQTKGMETMPSADALSGAPITVLGSSDRVRNVVIAVPESGADVEAVERALIAFALERTGGNRTRAARFLRLSRSALIYRMHKHGLQRDTTVAEQDLSQRQQQQ